MNGKEKKKLRTKYVKHIKNCISNFETLYKGEIEISYFEELLMYAQLCDHNTFYDHYENWNWPRKGSHIRSYLNSFKSSEENNRRNNCINNLRKDPMLNRIVMLKSLDI